MPPRVRKAVAPKSLFRWVDVEQAGMHVMRDLVLDEDVEGAYVKVCPTIRSSERAGVDSKVVRERLVAAGAIAVVIAPIVVPDSISDVVAPIDTTAALNPEHHLREWFAGVKGSSSEMVERAVGEALASVGDAGL